ncbi:MAG: hypothetical protein E7220_00165 [Clostridiales bacterium]|nr:hypothetical protein [Clostridiales bacterium]
MIKGTTRKRTYRAIYRLLDRVSPVPFDCGMICGAACCNAGADEETGIYLLPGEDKIHDRKDGWLSWSVQDTEEYDFPESWHGKVYFVRCGGPDKCKRSLRPIQCRTFPLAPYLTEDGELQLIYNDSDLPYCCPMVEEETELQEDFIRATYTVWKHLIRDPLIYDLVEADSREEQ